MNYHIFFGAMLALCLSMGTIFLASNSEVVERFALMKLVGLTLYAIAFVLYMWHRTTEIEEQKELIRHLEQENNRLKIELSKREAVDSLRSALKE